MKIWNGSEYEVIGGDTARDVYIEDPDNPGLYISAPLYIGAIDPAVGGADPYVWLNPIATSGGETIEDVSDTSYTVVSADNGKVKRFTNAALIAVTLPDDLPIGFKVEILAWGAGGCVIQDNGVSVVQLEGTIPQYQAASCVVVASDTWSALGGFV